MPIFRFALAMTTNNQLKILRLKLCMVFTQKFEFCFQILIPLVLKNFVFETSEGPLSSNLKKMIKITLFPHEYLPKGLNNFDC